MRRGVQDGHGTPAGFSRIHTYSILRCNYCEYHINESDPETRESLCMMHIGNCPNWPTTEPREIASGGSLQRDGTSIPRVSVAQALGPVETHKNGRPKSATTQGNYRSEYGSLICNPSEENSSSDEERSNSPEPTASSHRPTQADNYAYVAAYGANAEAAGGNTGLVADGTSVATSSYSMTSVDARAESFRGTEFEPSARKLAQQGLCVHHEVQTVIRCVFCGGYYCWDGVEHSTEHTIDCPFKALEFANRRQR